MNYFDLVRTVNFGQNLETYRYTSIGCQVVSYCSDVSGQYIDNLMIEEVRKRAASKVASRRQNEKRVLQRKQKSTMKTFARLENQRNEIEQRLQTMQ